MIKYLMLTLSLLVSFQLSASERVCGWLDNPSPANLFFTDSEAFWFISAQGKAPLNDASMNLVYAALHDEQQFVRTNVNYGFSCACLTVDKSLETNSITKVYQSEQMTLKTCLEDQAIAEHIPLGLN